MLVLAALIAVAPALAAQTTHRTPEQEVLPVEKRWNDARAKGDVATLDRILADDWTVTHANGMTDTKARYLADLKSARSTASRRAVRCT